MNEVFAEISKPVWWITVVIAGMVINVASSYVQRALDRAVGGTASWWRSQSQARQRKWEAEVENLRLNERARAAAIVRETRQRLASIQILLISIFVAVFARFIPTAASPSQVSLFNMGAFYLSTYAFFMSFIMSRFAGSTTRKIKAAMEDQMPDSKHTETQS